MSLRANGSYIGPRPAGPSTSVASGIWDLRTAERQVRLAAWPGYVTPDTYFTNVSLLLHMDGSGVTFTDSSGSPKTITAYGSATQSATQSKFGGKSLALGGGGDYISAAASSDFAFGTGDLTVEFWLYVTSSGGNQNIFDFRNNSNTDQIFLRSTSASNFDLRIAGNSLFTFTATSGQWNHFAISRATGTVRGYVNGTSVGSASDSTNLSANGPLLINAFYNATSNGIAGYVDEFRVTKGVARYTANFTPPAAAFPDI